jgi:hypothetical protein
MDELRNQVLYVMRSLSDEQVRLLLTYARILDRSEDPLVVEMEELLENPA